MSLLSKVGSFAKATATGAQAITGLGFAPTAVILYSANSTALATYQAADAGGLSVGFLSAGAAVCMAEGSRDAAVSPINAHTLSGAKAFRTVSSAAAVTNEATLTSLDSDGFTLNWGTNDGVARTIYYKAYGGDVVQASAHTFNLPTGTGNFSITGLGFRPDVVIFMAGVNSANPYAQGGIRFQLSAMDAALNCWDHRILIDTASPSAAVRVWYTDSPINGVGSSPIAKATPVSMDSDGYTLNNALAFAANSPVVALAMRGGRWKVGTFLKPSSTTGAQAVTGIGIPPKSIFLATIWPGNPVGVAANHVHYTIGAGSGAAAVGSINRFEQNTTNPTNAQRYSASDRLIIQHRALVTPPNSLEADATLTSFDADGWTLNWVTNAVGATEISYVAAADALIPPRNPRRFVPVRAANTSRGRMARGAWRRRSA